MAQLENDIHYLRDAGCADGMAARFQPAGHIERYLASQARFTGNGCLPAFTFFEETDMLAFGDLQDGKGVVQFSYIDIGGLSLARSKAC